MRMMTSKALRRVGLALAIVIPAAGLIVWRWVIPAVIVAAIRERHEGYVRIAGWWIGGSSAGVTGLELHEGADPGSPTWAAVDRVATDLSLGALLHLRFTPRRIVFEHPSIAYRIDANGNVLTKLPLRQSGSSEIPELIVRDGELAMRQEGRPEMRVRRLAARLTSGPQGPPFTVKSEDPDWGHPGLEGRFTPDFSGYRFRLTADRLPADPEKARRVPFVEEKVWTYIEPRGPIGVVLDYAYEPKEPGGAGGSGTSMVVTRVDFQRTTVDLPTLGLHGEEAVGPLTVQDKVVELKDVRGRMCGGRVAFSGPIDFQHKPTHYDLALRLDGVDLTTLPESWQLHRLGVRGRFTGRAGLKMALPQEGIDMTGSTGEGIIDGAEIRGIPLERLELTLRGEGPRPERGEGRGARGEEEGRPVLSSSPLAPRPSPLAKEGPFLPQWIRGDFRVKDVELKSALAHVEAPKQSGGTREVPVTGRVSLEATVRFPLGSLEDWKAYTARGTADIAGASIGGLDLGRLKGRLEMSQGIIEVADLRGRLVDRPEGGGRPPATEPPSTKGPLPRGGFRGRVRAEVVGDRNLQVELEGVELPIAELVAAAPTLASPGPSSPSRPPPPPSALPPPTPPPPSALPSRGASVSGRLTIRASGRSRGADPSDPRSWTLSGHAEMPEVAYRNTVVKDARTDLSIDGGRLVLPNLSGRLGDADFRGRLNLELSAPYVYDGELDTGDLPCRELVELVSQPSKSTQVEGTIAGRGEARGTLRPWGVATSGRAEVTGLALGRVAIGDVPVRWMTRGETIQVTAEEHQRYGGLVSAEARVPTSGVWAIEGTIALSKVDAAELSKEADARGSWRLTGHADGQARFRYTPGGPRPGDSLPLEAEAHLTAPDLRVGGVPARSVRLNLTMHEGNPRFEVVGEGLGGKVHVTGDGHLATDSKDDEVRAQVEALGLKLYEIWGALGTSGALADLRGRASGKGQVGVRGGLDLAHAQGRGTVELEELIYGFDYRLGARLRADVSKDPEGWRVGPLGGELFGGKVSGDGIWMFRDGAGRTSYGVDARVDRLMLARAMGFLPEADRRFGALGTLRVAGRADGSPGGTIDLRIDRGQINGLHVSALRVPGEWMISPDSPRRGELHVHRADGQIGGGRIGGEAHLVMGERRNFRARLVVDDVDLRVISREELGTRPVPGQISGYVNVYGTDPANPVSYRGELDFDLNQASLVDIALLDELDRQLGSTGGGVFDDGDLHGTIAERKVFIDRLTLAGPLMQVHAQGTVDFDGRLNLEVVVNNNSGVYQSGQAMMARAPNVADEVARRASQIDQVRDFISSRLMKFRITGTIRDPIANVDRSINPRAAIGFFLRTMSLSARSR